MGLFSTSTITCNERPSVGRNFRDTISESASPINRFTEKAETRSFDEIFYEADIAIREASNSMNKLWYKSVLESDTVESAIINEANIFSKIVEVIKTIFKKIKEALGAMAKKVRAFFEKIFKKKGGSEDAKDKKSDGKETRGTDKESTPTSDSEETTEKVTKAVDDVEKLEKEKKELEQELEKAKKESDGKEKKDDKKEEPKKEDPKKEEPKKPEPNKDSDSIDTKNIDTSSLDKDKKAKPAANNDMDSISVPDTSKLETINKKIEEKSKAIENKKKEIESISSANDGYPKIEDFDGDYAKFKQACIDYENAKAKDEKDAVETATKGTVKGNEDNVITTKAIEARLKELMGKYDEAAEVIKKNYKSLNNAPKIFPYFDLFTAKQEFLEDGGYAGGVVIESICRSLYLHYNKANPGSAVSIASSCIVNKGEIKESSLILKDGKLDRTALSKSLTTKTTLDATDKNCLIASCFKNSDDNTFMVMPSGYIETAKNINSKLSLEYFYKGASANDGLVGNPTEKTFSNLTSREVEVFLDNIDYCKKGGYLGSNKFGVISAIDMTLKTLDKGENLIIQSSYNLSNSVNSMKLEDVDKNFMIASVIPTLQKTVCNVASFAAQVINEVYSTRLKVCTEAYSAGNKMYDEILRLCVRNEVLAGNKK